MDPVKLTKQAMEIADQFKHQDLKQALLDVREAAQELQEENLRLREELSQLRAQQATVDSLYRSGEAYWKSKDGDGDDGPFCTRCWDVDSTLVRLLSRGGRSGPGYTDPAVWVCPNCNKRYKR